MSTKIKSLVSHRAAVIGASSTHAARVYLSVEGDVSIGITVDRAEFIAALRAEGILPAEPEPLVTTDIEGDEWRMVPADAVVILREALPEVTAGGHDERVACEGATYIADPTWSAARYRSQALTNLALAEYIDANPPKPPVDPEQVDALASILINADHDAPDCSELELARRLYLAGVRIEVAK